MPRECINPSDEDDMHGWVMIGKKWIPVKEYLEDK